MWFLSRNKKEQPSDSQNDSVQVMVEPSTSDYEPSEQNSNDKNVKDKLDQSWVAQNSSDLELMNQNADQQKTVNNQPNIHQKNSRKSSLDEMTYKFDERKDSLNSEQDEETREEVEISHNSILRVLVKKFFTSFIALIIIYLFGYYRLSFAWIFIVLVLYFVSFSSKLRTKNRLRAHQELENETNERKYIERVLVDLPNWVQYPDQEKVEFLNKSLKQMWPFLNLYIQKFLKETLLPDILNYLPDYLKSIRLEKIDLGSTPLRIGSIKCHTERSSRKEILLDLQIIYSGNASCKLSFFKFAAGIKDVSLFGILRVRLYPLTEHSPFGGSISLTFLNCPKFDFNLTNMANILDIPVLNNLLRNAVLEQIASHLVYPNVKVIPLSDIPMKTLKFNPPSGVIRLEIIEAKDLLKADYGLLGLGKSDPYCNILCSIFNLQTQVISNTVNPQWNFVTEFAIFEDQQIDIEVFDRDQNTKDDFLGRLTLRLDEYDCTGEKSHWINLEDTTTGSIHIRLTWLKLSSDLSKLETQIKNIERIKLIYSNSMQSLMQAQQKSNNSSELNEIRFASAFCLMIYLDCIRHLPKIDQLEPSVFVEIMLGSRRRRSIIVESECNPVFEQNFLFLCDQFDNEPPLRFEIHDVKSKKKIGQTALKLANLISGGRVSFDKPIHVRINQSLDCVLRVAIELRVLYQSGFRAKRLAAQKDSFKKHSYNELDQEDKNIIVDDPPEKDNIPSLDRMVMSTVEPFLMVIEGNRMDANNTEQKCGKSSKKDMQLDRSSSHPKSIRKLNSPLMESTNIEHEETERSNPILSFSSQNRPQISLSFSNLHDPNYGPIKVTVQRVINLPGQVNSNTFYFVKIRRFPLRSKKQICTQKIFDTSSPSFDESFNLINRQSHPLTQLEVRIFRGKVCSTFRIFKISTQITRVIIDLTRIEATSFTKYFDLEEIKKTMK